VLVGKGKDDVHSTLNAEVTKVNITVVRCEHNDAKPPLWRAYCTHYDSAMLGLNTLSLEDNSLLMFSKTTCSIISRERQLVYIARVLPPNTSEPFSTVSLLCFRLISCLLLGSSHSHLACPLQGIEGVEMEMEIFVSISIYMIKKVCSMYMYFLPASLRGNTILCGNFY